MKTLLFILILALFGIITHSDVVTLTDKNFEDTLKSAKYVMVKFYAPWCGHCKNMIPEYVQLAELVKDNDVVIGQLDATVQKQTGQKYKVQGYPTMKFFINGVAIDYQGARTSNAMFQWIKEVSQNVLEVITEEKINELKSTKNIAVYLGANAENRKVVELLNIVDKTLDYFASDSSSEKLVLYVNQNPIEYPSDKNFTVEEIKQWVMLTNMPTVVPLSSKEYLDWVFYDEATMKDVAMLLREKDVSDEGYKNFEKLCEDNKKNFKCCLVTKDSDVYGGVKGYLKAADGKSTLALIKDGLKQAYLYPININELTQQSWTQFATEVSEEKHKNIAAKEQEKIEYEHVKVLTDQNFTSFVNEHEVIFAEFYTTTCAHCVEFSKSYDALAKKVYADSSLGYEIVALDIKKNKNVATDLQIVSFPTFRVYISGQSVTYDGPRTDEAILNFIKAAKESKPIAAGSIAEVPSPSVLIYDPAETTSLKLLPALFARYPIYHIKEGSKLKVVLRLETESTYSGELTLEKVSEWLYQKTDPVLVDLLNPNVDNKLRTALESKIPILGLIDVEPSLSASLQSTLEEYCKQSTLICGYAKKDAQNFAEFTKWLGIESDSASTFLYINTETYDKYLFPNKIQELSIENITQFLSDIKEGKVPKLSEPKPQIKTEEAKTEEKKQQSRKAEEESESTESDSESDSDSDKNDKPTETEL